MLLLAIFSTLAYISLIYWVDRYEKEPIWLLGLAVASGIAGYSVWLLLFGNDPRVTTTVLSQALCQWGIFFLLFALWRKQFDTPLDGVVYGGMVGLGFGLVPLFEQLPMSYANYGVAGIIWVMLFFSLASLTPTAVVGAGWMAMVLNWRRGAGLLVAVLLVLLYHFGRLWWLTPYTPFNLWDMLGIAPLMTLIWLNWQEEQRRIAQQLREEVVQGVLTARQYELATSLVERSRYLWLLGTQFSWTRYQATRRFYHLCSKLAYQKMISADSPLVATLRQQLQRQSAKI